MTALLRWIVFGVLALFFLLTLSIFAMKFIDALVWPELLVAGTNGEDAAWAMLKAGAWGFVSWRVFRWARKPAEASQS
jgi:hypothetical protein